MKTGLVVVMWLIPLLIIGLVGAAYLWHMLVVRPSSRQPLGLEDSVIVLLLILFTALVGTFVGLAYLSHISDVVNGEARLRAEARRERTQIAFETWSEPGSRPPSPPRRPPV
jgi:hypothetical protein